MLTEALFVELINMSFTGGITILILLLVRLPLRWAPRSYCYGLWSAALFRLLCPFTLESAASLMPVNPRPVTRRLLLSPQPLVSTGIAPLDTVVNGSLPVPGVGASVNPLQVYAFVGGCLWLAGLLAAAGGSLLSFLRLWRRLKRARVWQPEGYYLVKGLETPFVLGALRPKIYLPEGLGEKERGYILLHERAHIRRRDPLWKLLAFLALGLHWFNPLVWLAFFLFVRDMEMSCDEAVIRTLGSEVKKEYASSLLALSTGRRIPGGAPLAFGEGDTRGRIRNVLRYRRPPLRITAGVMILAVLLCLGLALNPRREAYVLPDAAIAGQAPDLWLEKWSGMP